MFKELSRGFYSIAGLPEYGKQDVGISPAGVMDRFSFITGNILLGNPDNAECLEIIFPPQLEAESDMLFVLTGAPVSGTFIERNGKKINIEHSTVYKIEKSDKLVIGQRDYGFRTYLCFREFNASLKNIIGRKRNSFEKISSWPDKDGFIRVIEGPEFSYVENAEAFFNTPWIVSNQTSSMGMKLDDGPVIKVGMTNMISEAVADGTVQLTVKGPIILLRHRQTVGGYPRGFNVISADVDMLAQYYPGQIIRFKKVSIEEAVRAAENMKSDIQQLKNKFN